MRARYRDGGRDEPLEPARRSEYTIDLWSTSYVVRAGHRLRLEISSSEFDRYDRNLNVYEPWGTGCHAADGAADGPPGRRHADAPHAVRSRPRPGSGREGAPRGRAAPRTAPRAAEGMLDSWRAIAALLWLGFVGLATFQLIPLLTDQLVDVYGFGDAKAGLISAWYCGAGFVASVLAFYWLPRWDRRIVLFVALVLRARRRGQLALRARVRGAGRRPRRHGLRRGQHHLPRALGHHALAPGRAPLRPLHGDDLAVRGRRLHRPLVRACRRMRDALGDGALFAFFVCVWAAGLVAAAFVPRGTTSDASRTEPRVGEAAAPDPRPRDDRSAARRARASRSSARPSSILMASPVIFYIANGGSWAFLGRVGTWTGLSDGQVGIALADRQRVRHHRRARRLGAGPALQGGGPARRRHHAHDERQPHHARALGHARLHDRQLIGFGFTVYTVAVYLQAFGYVDPSGRLMASGGLAVYGGGALGPVILAQFIPSGADPSYVAPLIADAVIFLIAPVVFVDRLGDGAQAAGGGAGARETADGGVAAGAEAGARTAARAPAP